MEKDLIKFSTLSSEWFALDVTGKGQMANETWSSLDFSEKGRFVCTKL